MRRQYVGTARPIVLATLAVVSLASACSSDSTTPKPGKSADAGADGWTGSYNVTDVDAGQLPAPFLFDKVGNPWADDADSIAACEAYSTEYPTTRACLCTNCMELMHQCDALPGCREIRDCIWKSGCQDTTQCYLGKQSGDPTGCVDVIDKWGNTGDAVAISTSVLQCGQTTTANCPKMAQ